ncbi:hypothetical protein FQA39_LY01841 [Lamprigera yunnana]|nr:hypothetical protein FQA39_LY01841 [Lamprigera yunnana]
MNASVANSYLTRCIGCSKTFSFGAVVGVSPLATSHSSRIDIHRTPVIETTHYVAAVPAVAARAVVTPLATSHSSRIDIHKNPLIETTHVVSTPVEVEVPVVAAKEAVVETVAEVAPVSTSHTSRVDIHRNPVIATTHVVGAPVSAYAAVPAVPSWPAIASYRTVAVPHFGVPIHAASIHPW